MRRFAQTALVALALSLGVVGGSFAATTPKSAVQASGKEFSINLSRNKVEPSKLRLEFVNFGEDDHDLAVQRIGSSYVRNLGVTRPGERSLQRFKVRKGTYMLWCTLGNHRELGMSARLTVKKKPKKN